MASNWGTSGVCDYRQGTKPSVVWCSECDEGLCEDCKEHHRISKSSRNHETISTAEYKKIPTEVIKIATDCKIHNEKYELFCRDHDCPCCMKCVKSHKDCKGLTDINELIKNVKTSNAIYEIEQALLEVAENIKRIKTNRKDNLTSLEKQKREIEEEIKQTRNKINHHLDGLQDALMKELKAIEQKENGKIQEVLTVLKTKDIEITEFKENIINIKQHASELQTFLAIKHFEKDVAGDENFIQSITENDATNQANISCQFNKSLQQITANVQKFGKINVSSSPCSLSLQNRKQKQAQITVTLPIQNINNLTLTLQKRMNTEMSDIRGCSMLPGGRIVLSVPKGEIRVLKTDGSIDFKMNNIVSAFDVVFVGNDCIAVTNRVSNSINIIDAKTKKLIKSMEVHSDIDGAAYKDGHLIYCARQKGLQMISLSDESITNVTNTKLSNFAYVTTFGDKLFHTNPKYDSVTCCDSHGSTMWTFCDTSVLEYPLGISVDNDGNVFVVGCSSSNVVVISSDGQSYRQLLSSKDGLHLPQVLHYDRSANKLLVANRDHTTFLYEAK